MTNQIFNGDLHLIIGSSPILVTPDRNKRNKENLKKEVFHRYMCQLCVAGNLGNIRSLL